MLRKKKREDHVEEESSDEAVILDFAWIVFVGMQIGYKEKEIAHMHWGKWCDLFDKYKYMHNMRMKKIIFEEQKISSLMDLK